MRAGEGMVGEDGVVRTPDGRALRTMTRGDGEDLVVLEAGLGMSGLCWGPVHRAIGEHTRVVAYERAGFGASDPDERPRALPRLAADLRAVLDAHRHRRLVLVGHSWGGPIVRMVAAGLLREGRPPAGVVLVDPTDEHCELYLTPAVRATYAVQASTLVPLARLGLLERSTLSVVAGLEDVALRAAVAAASGTVAAARATASELRSMLPDLRRLRARPPQLGRVPVVIVSGQVAGRGERWIRRPLVEAHRRSAASVADGRLVPATRSGHMVPFTEPELVAEQVQHLLV